MTSRGRREPPAEQLAKRLFSSPRVYLRHDAHIDVRSRIVRELLGDPLTGRLLDVGCGDGRLSLQFVEQSPALALTLLDLSPDMLALARERIPTSARERVELVEASLGAFQPEARFDFVLCLGVLAHVPSVEQALRRLAELVGEKGKLVVQLTDEAQPSTKVYGVLRDLKRLVRPQTPYEHSRMTTAEVVSQVEGAGLRLEGSRSHWILPPFAGFTPLPVSRALLHVGQTQPWLARHGTEKILLFGRP